jgi:hypothetical protein
LRDSHSYNNRRPSQLVGSKSRACATTPEPLPCLSAGTKIEPVHDSEEQRYPPIDQSPDEVQSRSLVDRNDERSTLWNECERAPVWSGLHHEITLQLNAVVSTPVRGRHDSPRSEMFCRVKHTCLGRCCAWDSKEFGDPDLVYIWPIEHVGDDHAQSRHVKEGPSSLNNMPYRCTR